MTPNQLKEFLAKKFEIVDFVDLSELSKTPNAAFKFFKNIHRSEYASDCRIVVYTKEKHIDDKLIAHLYKTANFIDVSNWFVLLCTPTDIAQQLLDVCERESTDSVPFQNLVVDVSDSQAIESNFTLPDTICAIPWTNLEVRNDGTITPCCMSEIKLGNIATTSLESAFHSKEMQSFRQEFINGTKPDACRICWKVEANGLTSIRQHNIKRLKEPFLLEYFDHPKLVTIDLKFQNTCNFKCRICNPTSSSLFADESRKYLKIQIPRSVKWSEDDAFVDQFNQLLPHLTNIDMYGGEPFLIKKFSKVLQTAIETGRASHIRLHYNSNGSIWPSEFVEYWPYFKQVDIHFSIDAIGDRFNLQRGGNWEDVEKNILRIKNLNLPNLTISLMPSISVMSVYYIDEVLNWSKDHNFQIFVNYIREPREFSISNLTPAAKQLILSKYKDSQWPEMKSILQVIETSPGSDGQAFCQKIKYFDEIRNENFSESHFEIAKAMGYVYNKDL